MTMADAHQPQVAVIGGGVAGIVAAHTLQHRCRVTLFEQNDWLGGHTHTLLVPDGPDAGTPVDTGFIVFNERTYPLFIAFLKELGVASQATTMSFGFHCRQSGLVYAGTDFNGLFARRRNLVSPSFYRLLLEIGRFSRLAKADLALGEELGTLHDYIARRGLHSYMVDNYLAPMAAAIWSTPAGLVTDFPAISFLRFFDNHGLLDLGSRPLWRTVSGGSHSYVRAFSDRFSGVVRLGNGPRRIVRSEHQVLLEFEDGPSQAFDQVVIATHADQALALLADPGPEERRLLGPWSYQANQTVLHTDTSVLPPWPRAWACWNFRREPGHRGEEPVYVTYHMNMLQHLSASRSYLVTLNRPEGWDEREVLARMVYHHPTYTAASMATQAELPRLNGVRRTWFCGSYFGYGFHEDAVRAGRMAASRLLEQA